MTNAKQFKEGVNAGLLVALPFTECWSCVRCEGAVILIPCPEHKLPHLQLSLASYWLPFYMNRFIPSALFGPTSCSLAQGKGLRKWNQKILA